MSVAYLVRFSLVPESLRQDYSRTFEYIRGLTWAAKRPRECHRLSRTVLVCWSPQSDFRRSSFHGRWFWLYFYYTRGTNKLLYQNKQTIVWRGQIWQYIFKSDSFSKGTDQELLYDEIVKKITFNLINIVNDI